MPKKSYTLVTLRNVDNPNDWWTPCVLCTVYCAEIDQKRELVHFGKLTPPLAGRIPEMQMPMFKSATNDETWKKKSKKNPPLFFCTLLANLAAQTSYLGYALVESHSIIGVSNKATFVALN